MVLVGLFVEAAVLEEQIGQRRVVICALLMNGRFS